jgi:hypothetical protein
VQGNFALAASAATSNQGDPFHTTILNLSWSKLNGIAGRDSTLYWSTRVLEYWKKLEPKF